jgi:Flp pilus assembly CpaE family ATPase
MAGTSPAMTGWTGKMQVYLLNVGLDPAELGDLEARIRITVPNLHRAETLEALRIERLRSDVEEEKPCVLYPVGPSAEASFDQLMEIADRYREFCFVIFISNEIAATDYKRLLQTGTGDWVSTRNAPQEIADVLWRRMTPAAAPRAERRKAAIAALVPSGGGAGNATLAVEIGAQLKSSKATRDRVVCLIDLDFQNSHVCDYLDIEARLQIDELAANPGRLDAQLLELFLSHHSSGLDVLAVPRGKANPLELSVGALDALFGMLSEKYDLVLVDLPPAWLASTPPILSASALVLVVGLNTIPSLRAVHHTLEAVRAVKPLTAQIMVVLNRCETGLLGSLPRRQHANTVLRGEHILFVRDDRQAARESADTGVPSALADRRSRLSKDIAQLTKLVAGLQPAH